MRLILSVNPIALACLVLPLLTALISMWLGQDTNWDLQNYHLYNPYALLEDRHGLDLMPAGVQSYFNPFLDLLFFLSYEGLGPLTTGVLLGLIHGLNLTLLVLIGQRLLGVEGFNTRHAIVLAVFGGMSAGFLSELGTTFHDSTLAVLSTASVYLVIREERTGARNPWARLFLAGLLMGFACGIKPTFAIYAMGLCLALLLAGAQYTSQFQRAFVFGLGTVAGVVITGGYWFFHIWQLTGNPLFPQMNHVFTGEMALPYPMRDARFLPRSLLEALFYPVFFTLSPSKVSEVTYLQLSWLPLFLLAVGLGIKALTKRNENSPVAAFQSPTRVLFLYMLISYALWLVMFGIYRYLVPLEYFIPLIMFLLMRKCYPVVKTAALYVLLVAIALFNVHGTPSWGRAGWSEKLYALDVPSDISEVSTVLLMGQPLAWLVPSFPERIPFIQIEQNFSVSNRYWEEAVERADISGELRLIYDRGTYDDALAKQKIESFGFPLEVQDCGDLSAYLGRQNFTYAYCKVVLTKDL